MSYLKATDVLPKDLLNKIQDYIDGETIYIPRKAINRKAWGEKTKSTEATAVRNSEIFKGYEAGASIHTLSEMYYLSSKSIQRIIIKAKLKG